MRDLSDDFAALRQRLTDAERYLDLDGKRARLTDLEQRASAPDLWDDPDKARLVTSELSRVKEDVDTLDGLGRRLEDAEVLFDLAREEADESQAPELEDAVAGLSRSLDDLEL